MISISCWHCSYQLAHSRKRVEPFFGQSAQGAPCSCAHYSASRWPALPALVQGGPKGPVGMTFFDSIPFTASFTRYTPPLLNPYPLPDPLNKVEVKTEVTLSSKPWMNCALGDMSKLDIKRNHRSSGRYFQEKRNISLNFK